MSNSSGGRTQHSILDYRGPKTRMQVVKESKQEEHSEEEHEHEIE